MKYLQSAFKCVSTKWDFAIDGGAIASYNTGLFIPANCILEDIIFEIVTPIGNPTTNANFDLGYTGSLQYFSAGSAIASDPMTRVGNSFPLGGTSLSAAVCTGQEIIMSIGGGALTSGSMKLHFIYVESN